VENCSRIFHTGIVALSLTIRHDNKQIAKKSNEKNNTDYCYCQSRSHS
jgi:hypothetical protein